MWQGDAADVAFTKTGRLGCRWVPGVRDLGATVVVVTSGELLRDYAYRSLRSRILSVDLAPGQRLVERDLAAELDVSRIPLREAMRMLSAEGLVLLVPGTGALVAPFGPEDVAHLFDVREVLESLAARLAAARATADNVAPLAENIRLAREAIDGDDLQQIAAVNAAFHVEVIALGANPLLASLMGPLASRVEWLFRLTASRDPHIQCAEHEEIYALIAAGDEDGAATAAFEHIASGREVSVALASEWSRDAVDPEAVARSRRRRA